MMAGGEQSVSTRLTQVREELAAQRELHEQEAANRKTLVEKGIAESIRAQRIERRRLLFVMASVLPLLGGAFGWSYRVLEDQKRREEVEETRERKQQMAEKLRQQRVDNKLKQLSSSSEEAARQLDALESDFNAFRAEQQLQMEAEKWERRHQTNMLETTLRALGRRIPDKERNHIEAE